MTTQASLKIEVEEKKNYWQRLAIDMLFNVIMVVAMLAFLNYLGKLDLQTCFYSGCAILLVLTYPSDEVSAFFVTGFEIKNSCVYISYSKRNKKHEIEGSLEDFHFKQGRGSRANAQTQYLCITYKGAFILRQYEKWGWQKDTFNEALDYLKQANANLEP